VPFFATVVIAAVIFVPLRLVMLRRLSADPEGVRQMG